MSTTLERATQSLLDRTVVREAMHASVISCPIEAPLTEVARLMAKHRVHCVVGFGDVTEDDTAVWGAVTDVDLIALAAAAEPGDHDAGAAAASEVVMVSADETLRRAAQLMREHQVSHLLVSGPVGDRPIGVISTLDIARVIGRGRPTPPPAESRAKPPLSLRT